MTNNKFELETGKWYWYKQIADTTWRICYIGEDPDENQWMFMVDRPATQLDKLDLDFFDFVNIGPPPNSMPRTLGDMIDDYARQFPNEVKRRIDDVNRRYREGQLPKRK